MRLEQFRATIARRLWYNALAWTFISLFIGQRVCRNALPNGAVKAQNGSKVGELLTCLRHPMVKSHIQTLKPLAMIWCSRCITFGVTSKSEVNVIYCSREKLEAFVQELNGEVLQGKLVDEQTSEPDHFPSAQKSRFLKES